MALFITNSTDDISVRKEWISRLEIQSVEEEGEVVSYKLMVSLSSDTWERSVLFETDETLEGIQAKAVTILTALES